MTEDSRLSAFLTKNDSFKDTKTVNKRHAIHWPIAAFFTSVHVIAMYFLYGLITSQVYLSTFFIQLFLGQLACLGTTAGAHRLWSHQAYKARAPLRIFLAILFTMGFTRSIFWWVRTHRVHHKYTDTDADPHNSKQGFFFIHITWLVTKKFPEVAIKEKATPMQDIEQDWVAAIQRKYFLLWGLMFAFLIPAWIPYYLFGEAPLIAVCSVFFRLAVTYHVTSAVNSFAHMFGSQTYNRNITARENLAVSIIMVGEGWHNYHHTFPWDYKAAELGNNGYNPTTTFINLCAALGLAYDLKYPSAELVRKQMIRAQNNSETEIWGWGDTDMNEQDKELAKIIS